jgi:hypothetical protein
MMGVMLSSPLIASFLERGGLGTPLTPTTPARRTSSSSNDCKAPPVVSVFDDLFPVEAPGTSVPPALALTENQELERLLGYSGEELAFRTQAAGWKMHIIFVNASEATTLVHTPRDTFLVPF